MKKLLSVLLALLMLLSIAPFAFAEEENTLPPELCAAFYLSGYEENASTCHFVLILNEAFVAATPALSVKVMHKIYGDGADETTDSFDGSAVTVVPGTFLQNGKEVQRLQLIVPKTFGESEYTTCLAVAAGSFADAAGNTNADITLREVNRGGIGDQISYYSKVMQEELSLDCGLGVGAGDKITMTCVAEFPFEVRLDEQTIARVRGYEEATLTFSTQEEGVHTIRVFYEGLPLSTYAFTVYSQKEIYRRQRASAFSAVEDTGLLALTPLAAPLLALILPPLGVAAMAGPVVTLMSVLEAVASVFRVFNLLR